MEEQIHPVLESIGLNKNEIKIYLDLIGRENSSALEISKRTKIHRSNTYDAIRKLIEKGFISEVIEERKRLFKAMNPEKIKDYLQQKQQEVDLIVPLLKSVTIEDKGEEEISVVKGTFAIREELKDVLKHKCDINVFGASREAVETFGLGFLKGFHGERMRKKIVMRHIYNEDAMDRVRALNKMKYTEAKFFNKKYNTIASTLICGDTVLMIVFGNPPTAIKIKNKIISEAYSNHFQLLWKQGKVAKLV